MTLEQNEKSDMWWDDVALQENAFYWFKRYSKLAHNGLEWMDVYQEAVCRLMEQGVQSFTNQWGYLRNLCRNICSEWDREITQRDNMMMLPGEEKSFMLSVIDHYSQKLDCKCKELISLWYLAIPPIRDTESIISVISEKCGKIYKTNALHMLRQSCKKMLAQLIELDRDALFDTPDDFKKLNNNG